jgi:hypothetical protein
MRLVVFGVLVADMGPGPLTGPALGSTAVAGGFLAAALVAGGLWVRRRSASRRFGGARRAFYLLLGSAALFGTAFPILMGLYFPPFLLLAFSLLVACPYFVLKGLRTPREGVVPPEPPTPRED